MLKRQMLNVVSTRLNVTFDNKGGGTLFLGKKANGKKRATVPLTKRLRKEIEAALRATGQSPSKSMPEDALRM